MTRRDGAEVPEGDGVVIRGDLVGRDLSGNDPAEETVRHAGSNLLADDAAARFLSDARNSESARARAREHWLRQQAREAATLDGILRALSERGGPVTAWTLDGGRATGKVGAVSNELVLIRADGAADTWVVRTELGGIQGESEGLDAGVASDDRGPTSSVTLAGLLAELAEDRASITARCGGVEVSGRVAGSGTDVVTVRLTGGGMAYLPVSGLTLLRLT